jgi:hypothetical protein
VVDGFEVFCTHNRPGQHKLLQNSCFS